MDASKASKSTSKWQVEYLKVRTVIIKGSRLNGGREKNKE